MIGRAPLGGRFSFKVAVYLLILITVSAGNGLVQFLYARLLSPSDFGALSAGFAIVLILSQLILFGSVPLWFREFALRGSTAQVIVRYSIKFSMYAMLSLAFLYAILVLVGLLEELRLVYYLLPMLVALVCNEYCLGASQYNGQIFRNALHQFLGLTARLIPAIVAMFLYKEIHLTDILIMLSVTYCLLFLGVLGSLRALYSGDALNLKNTNGGSEEYIGWRFFLSNARPYATSALYYLIYFQSCSVMVFWFSNPHQAGIFSAMFLFINAIYLLPNLVFQRLLQHRYHEWYFYDPHRFLANHALGVTLMGALGIFCVFVFFVFSDDLISLIFGDEYIAGDEVLKIMSFAMLFRLMAMSYGLVLNVDKQIYLKTKIMGRAAMLSVTLNTIFISLYDAVGCAIALLLTDLYLVINYRMAANRGLELIRSSREVNH